MAHLIAYFGNEPENMACALFSARNALYSRSRGTEGFALGFIQGGDVLLQKRPRAEAEEVDLYALAHDLKANAMIGRVGLGQEGNKAAENADPFRYRSWLFGSVGTVPEFDTIRDRVLDAIPAYLRRNVRGRSASEHIFHLFLAYLHDAGIIDQPSPVPAQVEAALRSTLSFVSRLIKSSEAEGTDDGQRGLELALVATNGRSLVATVRSHAMQFLRVDGIADCPVCHGRANPDGDGRRIAHENLRAVVVEANAETQGRPGWRPVGEGTALIIGPDHVPHVVAIGEKN
jgi:glutamine phosphoribosylpyrophosphate amidotransferase